MPLVLKSSELRSMAHACKCNDSIDLRWKRCDMDQKSAFKNNVSPSEIKTKNSWKLALAVIWNSIPNSLDFEEISYNATSANIRHLEIRDAWEEKYLEHNHKATNCTWFYTFSLQLKMWILSAASLNIQATLLVKTHSPSLRSTSSMSKEKQGRRTWNIDTWHANYYVREA